MAAVGRGSRAATIVDRSLAMAESHLIVERQSLHKELHQHR